MERLPAGADLKTAIGAIDAFMAEHDAALAGADLYTALSRLVGKVERLADEVIDLAEDWRGVAIDTVDAVGALRGDLAAAEMAAWKRDGTDAERAALDDLHEAATEILRQFDSDAPAGAPDRVAV